MKNPPIPHKNAKDNKHLESLLFCCGCIAQFFGGSYPGDIHTTYGTYFSLSLSLWSTKTDLSGRLREEGKI